MGDSGPAVRQLQSDLTFLKYDLGMIDGDFGPKTYNAVVAFQRDNGLTQNGIVDIKTRDAIKAEVYRVSQGASNPDYEKDKVKDRLIDIVNKTPNYALNKSMSFDSVLDIFFKWYTEKNPLQYLEATYLALPEDYRLRALNHWADMINQGYDQGAIADYILPEDYFKSIPDRPDTDSNLVEITEENKYDSKAAFEYYKKYYYPVDALNEVNYRISDQDGLIRSRFESWARLVYGSSKAEKGQEFRIGIVYGFGMTGIKMASDCIEGMQDLLNGGYKRIPAMGMFLAKAYIFKDYRDIFSMMINQAVETWKVYNGAEPFDKGRMIGDLIGQTLLLASGACETEEGIKGFVESGKFETTFNRAAKAENVLKKIIAKYPDDAMKYVYKEGKYIPSNPQTLAEYDKLDKIASDLYNKFRASTDDVSKVAKNTGWDINDVQQIKNHMFIDDIKFASGEIKQFPPDYEQAVAWERLINGQFYESDILLIKHELYESTYMKLNACVQDIAHEATDKVFNWAELLKKSLGGN